MQLLQWLHSAVDPFPLFFGQQTLIGTCEAKPRRLFFATVQDKKCCYSISSAHRGPRIGQQRRNEALELEPRALSVRANLESDALAQ